MTVTARDAEQRRIVRLPDGRTGRLLAAPAAPGGRSKGAKARVLMPSGSVLSVAPDRLEVVR